MEAMVIMRRAPYKASQGLARMDLHLFPYLLRLVVLAPVIEKNKTQDDNKAFFFLFQDI